MSLEKRKCHRQLGGEVAVTLIGYWRLEGKLRFCGDCVGGEGVVAEYEGMREAI